MVWRRACSRVRLSTGGLSASAFVAGTGPGDADDRIIYNIALGALYFDPDGTGAAQAILFATVQPGTLIITSADFQVI